MQNEINFSTLFRTLKRSWWKIAIIALVAMILMASFTIIFIPKKYSSTMEIYIINTNVNVDYTQTSLLAAAEYLINDYVSIIESDEMLNLLANELGRNSDGNQDNGEYEEYINFSGLIEPKKDSAGNTVKDENGEILYTPSYGAFRSMISHSASETSSVFKLSVSDTNPMRAYTIAKEIAEHAPAQVTKVAKPESNNREAMAELIYDVMTYYKMDVSEVSADKIYNVLGNRDIGFDQQDCIKITIDPKYSGSHDSPNLIMNTVVAGVAAAVLAYVLFLILTISRSVITTEEDVKAAFEHPVIGAIPHWSSHIGKNAKGGSYYG